MSSLGRALVEHNEEIVHRWYERWCQIARPDPTVSEAALKDHLPLQLRVIGEQLLNLGSAEEPGEMWKRSHRLNPEARVEQDVAIEAVVLEYRIALDTIRAWIREHAIEVEFDEYSYLYAALFELTAETVRRYREHEEERLRAGRAHYLASVMHQLRTPLAALVLQVQLLDVAQPGIDASHLSRLRRNVRRLQVLVDGILRLERYEPQDVPLQIQEVRPAHLVEEIMSDFESEAERKKLRFASQVNRSLTMEIDPHLFIDALGNLVHNAIKFTGDGGTVLIDEREEGGEVCFRVVDTGPGIPEAQQRVLFRQPQPGSAGGTGIGLLIAQHAARAQGGRVEVESELGRGASFFLRLPLRVGR